MGISNSSVTKIVCDYKDCGKTFLLPDNPEENTPGVEYTMSLTLAQTGQQAYFCGIRHLIGWALDYAKAASAPPASRAHMAMVEIEDIPTTVDLSLKER